MTTGQPMSALESAFLGLESYDVPFQYASILAFDRPIELAPLRAHIAGVLENLPRYRQRIVRTRSGAGRWVADATFDITNHVDAIRGSEPLEHLAAQLLETELDRAHPPWHVWTVEGLPDGRGALIAVLHHSLVDGMAGFALLEHVLGTPRPPSVPRPRPAVQRLLSWKTVRALGKLLREGLQPASQIGLNPRHTGHARAVASHTCALERVKAIEHAFGATNNDVVLAVVAGAIRRLLIDRGVSPDVQHDVRAMVPVGRHGRGQRAAFGNRVVLLLVALHVDEPDPVRRLQTIAHETHQLKRGHTASAGDLLVALSDATSPAILLGTLRLALRLRGFNTIVTNVPGPPAARSLLGAQLTRIVPVVNLWPHLALGFAVASYAKALTFGIQVDRAVIPDPAPLRDHLAAELDALAAAALPPDQLQPSFCPAGMT